MNTKKFIINAAIVCPQKKHLDGVLEPEYLHFHETF
jgi:hypothetical protein